MRSVTPQFELCGSSVVPGEPSGTAGFPCGRQVRQDGAGEALAAAFLSSRRAVCDWRHLSSASPACGTFCTRNDV